MALNDLTGTTWKLLNTLYTYPVAGQTAATFTIAYTTSAPLTSTYGDEIDSFESVAIGYLSGNEVNGVMAFPVQTGSGICFLAQGHDTKTLPDAWENYFTGTFTITGGTDATNANLIAWLQSNAEQIIPDVAIKYNGEVISTLDYGQSVTLETEGKYMEDDVTVETNSVKQGSAGTPVATKGAVSNHAVTVTPSVTNTTGYITGGTLSGTAVTVSASELVSGTLSITENGTGIDVTNYANVDVNVSGGGGGGGSTLVEVSDFTGNIYYIDSADGALKMQSTHTFSQSVPSGSMVVLHWSVPKPPFGAILVNLSVVYSVSNGSRATYPVTDFCIAS